MANKVVVNDSEYSTLKRQLWKLHLRYLREMSSSISELKAINADSGFHAEELNSRIAAIISELNGVKKGIDNAFDASEEIVGSFKEVVDDYDAKL